MIDSFSQFRNAIRASGLEPPDIIEPGKLHRFPGVGKRKGNTAGWCMLFKDGLGGCFGDWSTGFSENWQAKRNKPFPPSKRAAFMRRVKKARAQVEMEQIAKMIDASKRATAIWRASTPAPDDHPYLIRKAIKANGARLYKGALVLPVMDFNGMVMSLQFINPKGHKRFLSGGRKHCCYIPVNKVTRTATRVIICEGWATGCTLAEDEPASRVLAAIDAGNLKLVAVASRLFWPSAELVIAGDDDRLTPGNPGATKARAAAVAANALLALPQWPAGAPKTLTDFNDLAVWLAGGGV